MIIFAVDPGTINMGFACYDSDKRAFITFGKYNMQEGVKKSEKTKYALLTKRFCDAMDDYLRMSDVIVIEAQMQAKMKMIQTALQCFYWDKSVVLGPLAYRKFFKISMSNYNQNKKASEKLSQLLIRTPNERRLMSTFDKKDDVADAIIMAKYWDYKERKESYDGPNFELDWKIKQAAKPTKLKKKREAPCARNLTGPKKKKKK